MKLTIEKKENFAEVFRFIEENVNYDMPFVPNLKFLGDVWGDENKMFQARVCVGRDDSGQIVGCSVRLISPNPKFSSDTEVIQALEMRPEMRGVLRMIDYGGNAELREFADVVSGMSR